MPLRDSTKFQGCLAGRLFLRCTFSPMPTEDAPFIKGGCYWLQSVTFLFCACNPAFGYVVTTRLQRMCIPPSLRNMSRIKEVAMEATVAAFTEHGTTLYAITIR